MALQKKRVAVIGAGPAGATAAYCLSRQGWAVDLYEAHREVGGLAQTLSLWGQRVDLGPHRFFSSDPRVNRVWHELVGNDYRSVDRLTRILYRKKFFFYPLKASNVLLSLGLFSSALCVLSYLFRKIAQLFFRSTPESFEDWVVSRFGKRLYRIFFKTYSEKLWGIPCHRLDKDFAAQRIKKLSLLEAAKASLLKASAKKHRTLCERFAYPVEGSSMVYRRMCDFVEKKGNRVTVNCPIRSVSAYPGRRTAEIVLTGGERIEYDHVVSTMPLTELVLGLPEVPATVSEAAAFLRYRSAILIYLNIAAEDLFPDQWIYVHSPDVRCGRITNFRNWVPEICSGSRTSILALEYWCYFSDEIWNQSEPWLIEQAKDDLDKTSLIGSNPIVDAFVYRIPKCYPVYERGYRAKVQLIADYLSGFPSITPIGREGSFKYNNQDHSILMGMLAAENVMGVARHNLWNINTDYESYQESAEYPGRRRIGIPELTLPEGAHA